MNINNKKFRAINNSNNGDVSPETIFHYRQEGNNIWATYKGGKIVMGTLIGKIKNDKIELIYQQINESGDFLTGYCDTLITIEKGKLRLNENWRWTCKDYSKGTSVLEEI